MIHLDPKQLDAVVKRVEELIPDSLNATRKEVQKTVRATAESLLQRMNLVTREEFDVQAELLAKTRERMDAMQARLDALERGETSDEEDSGGKDPGGDG